MREIPLCQVCKDPIWSYICSDCLGTDIKNWLPKNLTNKFSDFHNGFLTHFSVNPEIAFENCLHCKSSSEASLCPFCYIVEAFHWLRPRDPKLAQALYNMLPLAKDWKVTDLNGCVWREGYKPLGEINQGASEFGLCDECGEYSDQLVHANEEWICRDCNSQ